MLNTIIFIVVSLIFLVYILRFLAECDHYQVHVGTVIVMFLCYLCIFLS